jgi:glycerol-3-phosphate acyltransferase PlsX
MTEITKISIDAMGGDHGPSVIVPAVGLALQRHSHLHVVLVGQNDVLAPLVKKYQLPLDRVTLHPASQVVDMDELPSLALRHKKDSSMRVAINLVKDQTVQACVSAGNTGALVATSKFVLHTFPSIDRPAIISAMPTISGGHIHMLDLGANIDSTARQLFQFAVMGSVLTEAVENIPRPRIGLLNVGQEAFKGNAQVKEAAQLLAATKEINYVGFVEGDDIYKGVVDVVVCDGFAGNIALKASEGIAKLISGRIKEEFNRGIFSKLCGLIALPVMHRIKHRLDPAQYNGASLLGLQGTVIKSHGGANVKGFAQAIEEAVIEARKNVPHRIGEKIEQLMKELPTHGQ